MRSGRWIKRSGGKGRRWRRRADRAGSIPRPRRSSRRSISPPPISAIPTTSTAPAIPTGGRTTRPTSIPRRCWRRSRAVPPASPSPPAWRRRRAYFSPSSRAIMSSRRTSCIGACANGCRAMPPIGASRSSSSTAPIAPRSPQRCSPAAPSSCGSRRRPTRPGRSPISRPPPRWRIRPAHFSPSTARWRRRSSRGRSNSAPTSSCIRRPSISTVIATSSPAHWSRRGRTRSGSASR